MQGRRAVVVMFLILLLSVIVQTTAWGQVHENLIHVRYQLPLRGSVEQSLQRSERILKDLGAAWYEHWEHPRCLQARFETTSVDIIGVLLCEGLPWEESLSLGCPSFMSPATEQLCGAIQYSYLHDI